MPVRISYKQRNFDSLIQKIIQKKTRKFKSVDSKVSKIIEDVIRNGDNSLIRLTKKYDNFKLSSKNIRFSKSEIKNSIKKCNVETISALKLAAKRIKEFHKRQIPKDCYYKDSLGIRLGMQWNPIDSIGVYVPGGSASYPSSVLMNVIPAKVAGVRRIAMAVPSPRGEINPLVLAAANILGVEEIYRVGGAQAIAAFAHGTKSIDSVDKIVGPGNIYVSTAKRQVFGTVGIDMLAGPSEILIVADKNNNPDWIAIDLLSQAEHDPESQSILITDDKKFLEAVITAVKINLAKLSRNNIAAASWNNNGAVILVKNIKKSLSLINDLAPEHLELCVLGPEKMAKKVKNAGAIFLGSFTPEAVGDYIAGPNHVLPTSRSSRFSSGLGVLDFLTRSSLIKCNKKNLRKVGPKIIQLANCEGLGAHAFSVQYRIKS
jgi:histidinol dehydrogenase